jgi:hypothetical protein
MMAFFWHFSLPFAHFCLSRKDKDKDKVDQAQRYSSQLGASDPLL